MKRIILFVCVVLACLLVGLMVASGVVSTVNAVAPTTSAFDFAVIMQALAR